MNGNLLNSREKYGPFFVLLFLFIVIIFVGLNGNWPLQMRWLIIMFALAAYLSYIGKIKTVREYVQEGKRVKTAGRYDGIFIDARNKISLSHFQIILWTLVALSSWATLSLHRAIPVLQNQVVELRIMFENKLTADGNEGQDPHVLFAETMNDFLARYGIGEIDAIKLQSLYILLTGVDSLPRSGAELGGYDALNVAFPQELILAMGISVASLAGAAIIKNNKTNTESGRSLELAREEASKARRKVDEYRERQQNIEADIARISAQLRSAPDSDTRADLEDRLQVHNANYNQTLELIREAEKRASDIERRNENRAGVIHVNETVEQAQWSDLFSGEKVNDYQLPDIAKVQMFFFTIIIVFSYTALIWAQMSSSDAELLLWLLPAVSLPDFSESLVILLGLSHTGYLSVKSTG